MYRIEGLMKRQNIIDGRCGWCAGDELYTKYHDTEWGRPAEDEKILFEFLILEGAQAGLSWITILRKRKSYREAFLGFEPEAVAKMTEKDIDRLMQESGIIRNRMKIRSAVNNAKHFLEVQQEFGSFRNYILSFLPGKKPIVNHFKSLEEIPAVSPESEAISRDMKKRGFNFFGPVCCYSFLQAAGFVNDHLEGCICRR